MQKSFSYAPLGAILMLSALLASCNTTSTMEVPKAAALDAIKFDKPVNKQASFLLTKVVANLKRGTVIAHFPGGGVKGVDGYFCNVSHQGKATIEWGAGSSVLGNWSTELGEIFYDVLSQKGLNIAGDPRDLFGQRETASSAEYLIGARISEVKGNFCEAHHWYDRRPLDEYSGEMFVAVEWTVYSSLLKREILKSTTRGYFKHKKSKRDGVILTFHNAFANATENLLASEKFMNVALRTAPAEKDKVFATKIGLEAIDLKKPPVKKNIGSVLPAVVTIRVGTGHGSGFVVSKDGMILTNFHVVGTAESVGVILSNGLEIKGKVLRRSKVRDVALVKIPVRVPSALPIRMEVAKPLEKVYVIGSPLIEDLKSTVTTGIVSGMRRLKNSDLDFIQADAATTGGNSGGPMLDENGNIIGITVSGFTRGVGLNLFIPIHSALEALNMEISSGG